MINKNVFSDLQDKLEKSGINEAVKIIIDLKENLEKNGINEFNNKMSILSKSMKNNSLNFIFNEFEYDNNIKIDDVVEGCKQEVFIHLSLINDMDLKSIFDKYENIKNFEKEKNNFVFLELKDTMNNIFNFLNKNDVDYVADEIVELTTFKKNKKIFASEHSSNIEYRYKKYSYIEGVDHIFYFKEDTVNGFEYTKLYPLYNNYYFKTVYYLYS